MSIRDPKFRYTPASDMKPGYLAEKFRRIRREQAEQDKAERDAKVQTLPRRKAAHV